MKKTRKILSLFLAGVMTFTVVSVGAPNGKQSLLQANAVSVDGNTDVAKQAAEDGMVLLKNSNNALPLKSTSKVALFGTAQINMMANGGGSGSTNAPYVHNFLQGLQQKQQQGKVTLYQPLVDAYTSFVSGGGSGEMTVTDSQISSAAAYADTAVVFLSRNSGEGWDRSASAGDYYLSAAEQDLFTRLNNSGFQHIVVVLNIPGVVDTSWIANYSKVDSVLVAWYPGMEGGYATADILCGDTNPSGKLVDTFAKSYNDYPTSSTFNASTAYVNYSEDIYDGYRYFETFDPTYSKVNYEFGFGLSYTTFQISNVSAAVSGGNINVTATVTNTGSVAGREIVQAYYSAPQGLLGKPAKVLAAFAKTKLLAPNESQALTMTYAVNDMASYDDTGKVQKSAYVLEAGNYNIYVGDSIRTAGQQGVRYTYTVPSTIVTQQLTQALTPSKLTQRLLANGTYEPLPNDLTQSISATGTTKLECENYVDASANVHIEDFTVNGTSGKCAAYLSPGTYLSYSINVAKAGTYALSFRAANGRPQTISNMLNISVNGTQQTIKPITLGQTGDGDGASQWYNFVDTTPVLVSLPAGQSTLRLDYLDSTGANLDYITFYGPTVSATQATKIESENFTDASSNISVETFYSNNVPQGKCIARMVTGNYITYNLDAEQASTYSLTFHAANGNPVTLSDMFHISINGTQQSISPINLAQTGDGSGAGQWYNFVDTTPVTVTLPAGQFTLRLDCSSATCGNIDYMTFTKTGVAPQAAAVTAVKPASSSASPLNNYITQNLSTTSNPITLLDVYNDPSKMDAFISQLPDAQLATLLGGRQNTIPVGTGGIGDLSAFGIPNAQTADGPAGYRLYEKCTAWPCGTLLACSWDVDMVRALGVAAGVEGKANNVDIWLAPGMDIHHDPLCGRNFEYFSEDPLVTGKMAAAITEGVQSQGIAVTIKHFACNEKENNRGNSDSRVSERALREVYLRGFEIAVKEAQPWCIMSSYNLINGTRTSESYDLLTTILRGEWGYQGLVMTDWGNGSTQYKEIIAGNDVRMSSGDVNAVLTALQNGQITRAQMETNAKHVLNVLMKTNVFQKQYVNPSYFDIAASGATSVKAANYSLCSDSIATEPCSDTGINYNVANENANEWLKYNLNVATTGNYSMATRLACNAAGATYQIYVDDVLQGTYVQTSSTGGWQSWVSSPNMAIRLPAGKHVMKVLFTASGMNISQLNFALTADTGTLQTLYSQSKDNTNTGYTNSSWSAFQTKLAAAKTALDNVNATQAQVNTAASDLQAAVNGLVAVDKTALQTLYNQNKDLTSAGYTTSSWNAFQTKLAAAKAVLDNGDANQAAVDAAKTDLQAAVNGLAAVGKTALQTLYDQNKDKTNTGYTTSSWSAFQTKLAAAKVALDNGDADQAAVDAARADLQAAVSGLVAVDKTALQSLYNQNKNKSASDYTASTWSVFQTKLAAAKAALDNADADQTAVDAAKTDLQTAVSALVDISTLKTVSATAAGLKSADYTAESWAAVQSALTTASTVLADGSAKAADIAAAKTALENAIAALKAVIPPVSTPVSNPASSGSSSSSSGAVNVPTGDNTTGTAGVAVLLVLMAAAGAVTAKRLRIAHR